jgi:acyl-CoA synthetase (AMP-forming)/AMP-acid ligase II
VNIGYIPLKSALRSADSEALIDIPNKRRMTFGELEERVCRLANGLTTFLGVKKGDRVAVLSKNCIEYMEIFFACARVGLICQPLNWRLGEQELLQIIEDASPSILMCSEDYCKLSERLTATIQINKLLAFNHGSESSYELLLRDSSPTEPAEAKHVGDEDPVMILYTGGTTGRSKGALHSHKSVYMGMLNQTVAERVVPTDVYMLTGQMFHIPIVLAINYMSHGCPVVLINFEAKLALEVIQSEKVSAFLGITTMLNWMMAVDNFEQYDLSSLRNIQYGGGPMPPEVVKAALKSFPCTLIQGYGQTEGTTMSFLSQEDHSSSTAGENPERLASCGREGYVTSIRIVDPEGNSLPKDGESIGEIIVKSEANMIGYWQQPELTSETIKDGWMWTGDLAVWDYAGYIYIVDRAKDMIISGGENIYSAQVEAAIHQHPAVLESAVIGIPSNKWGESVHAVVVLKPGKTASEDEIIAAAKNHLASYQKPQSVEFVDSLPKAPTGKILKRDLRDSYWQQQGRK